jgi:hypothetical protein
MTDLVSTVTASEELQILALASVAIPALFDIYLRAVTRRRVRDSVLGKELDAFFEKLQVKWASKARDLEGQR